MSEHRGGYESSDRSVDDLRPPPGKTAGPGQTLTNAERELLRKVLGWRLLEAATPAVEAIVAERVDAAEEQGARRGRYEVAREVEGWRAYWGHRSLSLAEVLDRHLTTPPQPRATGSLSADEGFVGVPVLDGADGATEGRTRSPKGIHHLGAGLVLTHSSHETCSYCEEDK